MRVKRILYLFAGLGLICSGCQRKLDLTNPNRQTTDAFWKTKEQAYSGCTAIYNALTVDGTYMRSFPGLSDSRGDDFTGDSPWLDLDLTGEFIIPSTSDPVFWIWRDFYLVVNRANQVIKYVGAYDPSVLPATEKNRILGQAYFLRGLAFYNLALSFRGIPIITEPFKDDTEFFTATGTDDEIWKQIYSDLSAAETNLPISYDNVDGPDKGQKGRATKGAAAGLLGKAYLYRKDYANAAAQFQKFLAGGPLTGVYSLMTDYRDNFKDMNENNNESLFEVQFTEGTGTDINWAGDPLGSWKQVQAISVTYGMEGAGFSDYLPTRWIYNEYKKEKTVDGKDDPRLLVTIASREPGDNSVLAYGRPWFNPDTAIYPRKYTNDGAGNGSGFGTKVTLFDHDHRQFLEQSPVRGYSSCVDNRLFFGVAAALSVDSVVVQWPDEKVQVIRHVKANQYLQLHYRDAAAPGAALPAAPPNSLPVAPTDPLPATPNSLPTAPSDPLPSSPPASPPVPPTANVLLTDVSDRYGIDFKHNETTHSDFSDHQPILQKYSQLGPCITVGDVNGDGLEDFFVGGAANQSGKIFIQRPVGKLDRSGRAVQGPGGRFEATDLVTGIKSGEDLGAIFFDADGDKDLDLLVTGGSSEFSLTKYNQPRLYLNDGNGHFTWAEDAVPPITDVTKAVAVADIDGDGDLDVFIGGRLAPQHVPRSPRSYLLRNDHGKFTDVTKEANGQLLFPGMITDAVFADFDGDQQPDLVICGEWMGIRFFKGSGNLADKGISARLVEVTNHTGLDHMDGLWRCLHAVDIDKDGDMDFVVGNTGLNNRYGVTPSKPMKLFSKDMDDNGSEELIPAYYIKDGSGPGASASKDASSIYQLYPALDRNQLAQEIPVVKKKYLLHKDFSTVTMARLMNDFGAGGWTELTCGTAASIWLENKGGGKFIAHSLPVQAQFAPVNCIVAADVDGDAVIDLILAGNEYQTEANTGRYDASYGLILKGDGKGGWKPANATRSGLFLDGDIRDMKVIRMRDRRNLLLAAPNDNRLMTFQFR